MKGKPIIAYQKYVINDFYDSLNRLRLDEDGLLLVQ